MSTSSVDISGGNIIVTYTITNASNNAAAASVTPNVISTLGSVSEVTSTNSNGIGTAKILVPNMGVNIKNPTTETVKVLLYGIGSSTFTVGGNYVTSISATSNNRSLIYEQAPANGGTLSPVNIGYLDVVFNYSSGASSSSVPSTVYGVLSTTSSVFSGASSGTFGAPNTNNGEIIVSSKGVVESDVTYSSIVTMTETVTWTPTEEYNSAGVKSCSVNTTATASQAANNSTSSIVYDGDITINISADSGTSSSNPLPASGGTSTLSYSASQLGRTKYVWDSGDASYSTYNTSTSRTPSITGSATGFSLSGTTVTAADRGTEVGGTRSVTYTASYGGVSKSVTIYQQENTYSDDGGVTSYGSWSGGEISFNKEILGAGVDEATVYIAPWKRSSSTTAKIRTWTSGSTETITAAFTGTDYYTGSVEVSVNGGVASLSATSFTASSGTNRSITISKSSYGTTEVSATSATVTANPTGSGPGTTTGAISIEANKVESDPCYVTITSFSYSVTPWGDTTSSSPTFAGRFVGGDVTYASGSTVTRASQNFTSQTSAIMLSFAESAPTNSLASVNSSTGIISWGESNTDTSRTSVGVTMTLSYQYGKAYTTTASTVAYHGTGYTNWEMLEFNCSTVVPIPVTEEAYFTTTWERSTPSGMETMEVDCSPSSFYNDGSYGSGYRVYVQHVSPDGEIVGGTYIDVDS